jgi:hypothetical protein
LSHQSALKQLRALAAVTDFPSDDSFLAWANDVQHELWSASSQFANSFDEQIEVLRVDYTNKKDKEAAFKRAYEIVHEAISHLERKIQIDPAPPASPGSKKQGLAPPERVTIPWLLQHVSVPHWVAGGVFLFAVFGLGIAFGQSQLYALLSHKIHGAAAPDVPAKL